jgi:hypothetical protein
LRCRTSRSPTPDSPDRRGRERQPDVDALARAEAETEPLALADPHEDEETDGLTDGDIVELGDADVHADGVDEPHIVAVAETDALADTLADPVGDGDVAGLLGAAAPALAAARDTARMALAPSLPLLGVPSISIMSASSAPSLKVTLSCSAMC